MVNLLFPGRGLDCQCSAICCPDSSLWGRHCERNLHHGSQMYHHNGPRTNRNLAKCPVDVFGSRLAVLAYQVQSQTTTDGSDPARLRGLDGRGDKKQPNGSGHRSPGFKEDFHANQEIEATCRKYRRQQTPVCSVPRTSTKAAGAMTKRLSREGNRWGKNYPIESKPRGLMTAGETPSRNAMVPPHHACSWAPLWPLKTLPLTAKRQAERSGPALPSSSRQQQDSGHSLTHLCQAGWR